MTDTGQRDRQDNPFMLLEIVQKHDGDAAGLLLEEKVADEMAASLAAGFGAFVEAPKALGTP